MLVVQGQQQRAVDTAIFLEYLAALSQDNEPLVEFYTKRVHGEFEVALDAWLATDPFEDPQAPAHPFVMEEYSLTVDTLAAAKREEASGHIEQAKDANHISDAYVLNTVLMALVLFFAGIAPKFSSTGVRRVVLALGTLMLIGGLARVTTLPITDG